LIGDLNRDGNEELYTGEQNYLQFLYSMGGVLLSGWPQLGSDAGQWQTMLGKVAYGNQLHAVTPRQYGTPDSAGDARGFVHAYDYGGVQFNGWPLRPLGVVAGMSFTDLNSDGSVEIVISGWNPLWSQNQSQTTLNVYTIPGVPFNKDDFPWPMYAHDRYRTNQLGFVPPDEAVGIEPTSQSILGRFNLHQNYPNPFNQLTIINYQLSIASQVLLKVYDVLGREVGVLVNDKMQAGSYNAKWDASGQPSGVYFCRLSAGDFSETIKIVLMK